MLDLDLDEPEKHDCVVFSDMSEPPKPSSPVVDPFELQLAMAGISVNNDHKVLLQMAKAGPHVAVKTVFLSAQSGKGLEILGTFSRRDTVMNFEMSLTNRSLQNMNEFAIQFNKNQ